MKQFTLALLFIFSLTAAVAQNGFVYQPFSVGVGAGITTAYGNTATTVNKYAFNTNFNYTPTPFFSLSLEGQSGALAGGLVTDYSARRFSNTYLALLFHADLQAGELINYDHSDFLNGIKNVYVGTGIGILNNDITYIQTIPPAGTSNLTTYPYLKTSTNVLIPLRLGYEFKIFDGYQNPRYRLDVGYSFNTALGKGLDGYTTLSSVSFYSYFSIGFKYAFGEPFIYRKPIPYYGF